MLDYVIGVVYELMGMCEQRESFQTANYSSAAAAAGDIVMEVIREVRWLGYSVLSYCSLGEGRLGYVHHGLVVSIMR